MKRILSLALALCMLIGCAALLGGCSNNSSDEWPVTIGDVTIDSEPKNIVVLSDTLADIVSYIGYDVKMVGRSSECDQDYLYVIPIMGSITSPDIDAITAAETNLVIADDRLSSANKKALEDAGLKVLVLKNAETENQLSELYVNLGTALGGKTKGAEKGKKAYKELFDTLGTFKSVSTGTVQPTVYLYLNENGQLCSFAKGTLQQKFFNYCGGTNVMINLTSPEVNELELRMYTPAYIFYDSPEVLEYLKNSEELSRLTGLVNNHTMQIPLKCFYRYGTEMEKTAYTMLSYIEKISKATPDEATPDEIPTEAPSETATEAPTEPEVIADEDVVYDGYSEDYGE